MVLAVIRADCADDLALDTDDFVGGVVQLDDFVFDRLFLLFGGVGPDDDDHALNLGFGYRELKLSRRIGQSQGPSWEASERSPEGPFRGG